MTTPKAQQGDPQNYTHPGKKTPHVIPIKKSEKLHAANAPSKKKFHAHPFTDPGNAQLKDAQKKGNRKTVAKAVRNPRGKGARGVSWGQ